MLHPKLRHFIEKEILPLTEIDAGQLWDGINLLIDDFSAGTKTVFCTYPAKRAPSASMTATTYVTTHASTISDVQTMDSGVLAGPVTVSGNVTVTGTLVII